MSDDNRRREDLPPLSFRAGLGSVNRDARTVDLVWTTGAPVRRYDWLHDRFFLEKLSLKPEHVRLERLNSGAPLLDSHSAWSLANQIGVVEDDSATLTGKKGIARVRFSKRADVEPIFEDVVDRVIRNVSVGYAVYKYEETPAKKEGDLTVRTAIDWEPFEISMVPMPADYGAQTRDAKPLQTFPCDIVIRGEAAATEEIAVMDETPRQSETIVERNPLDPGAPITPAAAPTPPHEPTDTEIAAANERRRVSGIIEACRAARMPAEMMDRLIREGTALEEAQSQIFRELRLRGGDTIAPQQGRGVVDVALGADPMVHIRGGIEAALLHRVMPDKFPMTDPGRLYRGLTLLDIGKLYLQGRGARVTHLAKNELAAEALGLTNRAGMHTTSDFADLLGDVARKTLRAAYEEQPQTFLPLVKTSTLPDYRPVRRLQFGDAPSLLEIKEHGEYTYGTIGEGKEQYQIGKYGRKFAITREAMINDDTNAFSRLPQMFGRKARILESDLVWAQITSNPIMGDGNALFSAAHNNLETDGDHISVDSLGRARGSLRRQVALDGSYLNLSARYLIVPTTLETKAEQYVTVVTPQLAGQVNPFQGRLTVIAEPRLDADSEIAWYIAASPDQLDLIEIAYLEGEAGPQVEQRAGWDIDGVEFKCRFDVGVKVLEWRGLHKDPGDLDT